MPTTDRPRLLLRCFPVLLIALGSVSCLVMRTINFRELPVEPKVQLAPAAKLPLHVAIAMPEAFKSYTFPIHQMGISGARYRGNILLGRNLTIAFYQMAGEVFRSAFFMEGFVPGHPPEDPDAQLVLVPTLEHFDFQAPISGLATYSVVIKVSLAAYDSRGLLVKTLRFEVEGSKASLLASLGEGHYEAVKTLLDETAADLLVRIATDLRAQGSTLTPRQP